jgi:hypothetical protein
MYLLTNPRSTYCGIFDLPIEMAVIELGLKDTEIVSLLEKMQNVYHRIAWDSETEEVCILHWLKYNTFNEKQKAGFDNALKAVRSKKLVDYLMGIDTLSMGIDSDSKGMDSDGHNNNLNLNNTLNNNSIVLEPKKTDTELIISKWNEVEGIAHIDCIEHKRLEHVKTRIEEKGFDKFLQMIENVKVSPFLLGKIKDKDGKAFKATFDWCILPNNFQKVLDGNYIEQENDKNEKGKRPAVLTKIYGERY